MNLNPIKANMTELHVNDNLTILFSYKTPVAAWISGLGYLRTDKKWSNTTTRHINQWLAESYIDKQGVNDGSAKFKPQEFFDRLVDGTSNLIAEVK
jgi:hypothetical protein